MKLVAGEEGKLVASTIVEAVLEDETVDVGVNMPSVEKVRAGGVGGGEVRAGGVESGEGVTGGVGDEAARVSGRVMVTALDEKMFSLGTVEKVGTSSVGVGKKLLVTLNPEGEVEKSGEDVGVGKLAESMIRRVEDGATFGV